MRRTLCLASLAIAGCAATGTPSQYSWPRGEFPDQLQSVDTLAGAAPRDCGFFRYSRIDADNHGAIRGRQCALGAMHKRQPFKFGTSRVPIDSISVQALVGASDGTLWLIEYGFGLGDESTSQVNYTCKSVVIDQKTFDVVGKDCARVSNGAIVSTTQP